MELSLLGWSGLGSTCKTVTNIKIFSLFIVCVFGLDSRLINISSIQAVRISSFFVFLDWIAG